VEALKDQLAKAEATHTVARGELEQLVHQCERKVGELSRQLKAKESAAQLAQARLETALNASELEAEAHAASIEELHSRTRTLVLNPLLLCLYAICLCAICYNYVLNPLILCHMPYVTPMY
jgi:hypothetical protein